MFQALVEKEPEGLREWAKSVITTDLKVREGLLNGPEQVVRARDMEETAEGTEKKSCRL